MVHVITSVETARGCGYRKPSKSGLGIYLIGGALTAGCGRLPLPLHVCPVCSAGIKPSRSWTWIDPNALFELPTAGVINADMTGKVTSIPSLCNSERRVCEQCPIGWAGITGRHGLLWIGEQHYSSPHVFLVEARGRGVSRKINAIPKGFELGKTWVFLAHRKTIPDPETPGEFLPGVFSMFRPSSIDLVVADEHSVPERAKKLVEEFGESVRVIKVVRDVDSQERIFPEET